MRDKGIALDFREDGDYFVMSQATVVPLNLRIPYLSWEIMDVLKDAEMSAEFNL